MSESNKDKLGNPLAVMAATEVLKSDEGKKAVQDTFTAVKVIVVAAGALFVGKLAYKYYKKWRSKKYARENADKPEVQIALMFYHAMIGDTFNVLGWEFDIPNGTDEAMLNELALQADLLSVAKAYKNLFDRELFEDVNSELDSEELKVFFNRLKTKGSDTTTPAEKLKPFPVKTPVYCRNKNGITLLRADFENGKIKVTNENMDYFQYAKRVGVIHKIVKDENNEIFYVIDRDYKIDSVWGYGYVNHRDVTDRNPDN